MSGEYLIIVPGDVHSDRVRHIKHNIEDAATTKPQRSPD